MKFLKYFESTNDYDIDGLHASSKYLNKDQLIDILQDILDDFNVYKVHINNRIIQVEKREPFPWTRTFKSSQYSKNGFTIDLMPFECTQDEVDSGYPNLYPKYQEMYNQMFDQGYIDQLNDRLQDWNLLIKKSTPFRNCIHIEIIEMNSDPSSL